MILTTERLLLREFVEEDWPAILNYQNDPRYLRFYPWNHRTEAEVRAFIQRLIASQHEHPRRTFQFAITLASENQLIGNCGIRLKSADATEAETGYELAPDNWGHGYATEAAHALLNLAFSTLKLHRVWAQCIAENSASAHVMEKLGMRCEGRLRESEWMHGRWWDMLVYGILTHEWQGAPHH